MERPNKAQRLQAEFVIEAYRQGFFPMADSVTGGISWYSPDPRAIIPLETFHVPQSLKRILRKREFDIRVDTAFEEVIGGCADRPETWISSEIKEVYCDLHRKGFAHSVESWRGGKLVGGLYGVAIGAGFFGESMFSRRSNASSVALASLVVRLRERNFRLLDSQFINAHIARFGAIEISRELYLRLLKNVVGDPVSF